MKNKNLMLEDGGVELAIRNVGGRQAGFSMSPGVGWGAGQTSRQTNKLANSKQQLTNSSLSSFTTEEYFIQSSPGYTNPMWVLLMLLWSYYVHTSFVPYGSAAWGMVYLWCSTLPGRKKSSNAQEDCGLSSA